MTHLLHVPFQEAVRNLFPDAPLTPDNSLIIPHGLAETTILRRLGIETPAPILSQFTFTGNRTPFKVQLITCEMLSMNTRAYVLSGMGVGKTACPLWTFAYLKSIGQATRMLVNVPLSTLDFVWMAELLKIASPLKAVVVHGTRKKRLKLLAQPADIYIVNHDGLEVIYDELVKRTDIDVLCIDELAVFRNNNGRTKLLAKYASRIKWVWGMTGSPTPQAPTDVWNQAKIVTPNTVPKYFGRFREELMVPIAGTFKWLPRHNAAEKAYHVLQPSVRYTLEDVGELPGYISRRIDVPLGTKQLAVYDTIRNHALAILGRETVSAPNKGVLLGKLLQISLGYVYTKTKGVVALDNGPRIRAILDLLDATDNPLLIFAGYKHALAGFTDAITRAGWNGTTAPGVVQVDGDTPARERGAIFNDFQNMGRYKALVAHPQCLAHGLTLTAADTVVWAGPISSLEMYDQANARIRRTGQDKKQQFIHLQGTAAERKLYSMLIDKQNVQSQLLSLFEDEILT